MALFCRPFNAPKDWEMMVRHESPGNGEALEELIVDIAESRNH